ncbi:MAG TPA: extracellular solute-binding protein [Propionibacteriaceae bacterium]|nr:extracellular solute-binding protein [Propionibacteriaceae bacterium]
MSRFRSTTSGLVASALLLLTACTTTPAAPQAAPSGTAPSHGDALTVWVMGDSGTKFQNLVAPFEKTTGIKVTVEAIPWESVNDRVTSAVASGKGPDVTQIGLSQLATFLKGDALADISAEVGSYPNLAEANFPAAVSSKVLNPNGGIHSIPWIADTRVLFYRSDLLSAAGIAKPPATWDELRADAKTLTNAKAKKYGYYIPQWDAPLPVTYTWQTGAEIMADGKVDVTSAGFTEAVDHYLGLYADGSVPTAADFDQTAGFINGSAAMLVSGPYLAKAIQDQAPDLKGKWNVTTVPTDKNGTSLYAGSNMGVWKNTTNKTGALMLLDFLANPSTQVAWYASNGDLPAAVKAYEDPKLSSDPLVSVYAQQLKQSRLLPVSTKWDAASSEILTALNKVAISKADRASTLQALAAKVAQINSGQ